MDPIEENPPRQMQPEPEPGITVSPHNPETAYQPPIQHGPQAVPASEYRPPPPPSQLPRRGFLPRPLARALVHLGMITGLFGASNPELVQQAVHNVGQTTGEVAGTIKQTSAQAAEAVIGNSAEVMGELVEDNDLRPEIKKQRDQNLREHVPPSLQQPIKGPTK